MKAELKGVEQQEQVSNDRWTWRYGQGLQWL